MKHRTISIILAVFLLVPANSKAEAEQTDSALQIYLPREITIEDDVPNLGQVAIVRGEEGLAAKAEQVTLGRISAPGQKIIVDRETVLSRLACSGIATSEVTFTGAERMTVSQQHQIIRGEEFAARALAFLEQNPPAASICQYNPIRIPQDLILPAINEDIKLSPRIAKSKTRNQVKVSVSVISGNVEIDTCEVVFGLKYNSRRLITNVDLPKGTVIDAENTKVEKFVSDHPEPANWAVPYGFVTKRQLPANTVISKNMIGPADVVAPAKPPVLFKRNQNVVIKIDGPGLFITAIGKAMQDGRVDEYIKVQNVDSERIILAKVNEDGSVEPVY
ncbi:MAG: flagellar basal body P-ring formation chaperone FlgA [Phycisphaerae bacterium]|jgi:flagella basal body P-ring formation protein FlgA